VYFTTKKSDNYDIDTSVGQGANFTVCNSTLVSTLSLQLTKCIHLEFNERFSELIGKDVKRCSHGLIFGISKQLQKMVKNLKLTSLHTKILTWDFQNMKACQKLSATFSHNDLNAELS